MSAADVTQDQTVDGMPLEDDTVIHYTTCSTAAATAAKTAALSGFKLGKGAWAAIKFTVTNAAAIDVVAGRNLSSSPHPTVAYKTGRTKALVMAWSYSNTSERVKLQTSLFTGMSNSMSGFTDTGDVGMFVVESTGNIKLMNLYDGGYIVIWFN